MRKEKYHIPGKAIALSRWRCQRFNSAGDGNCQLSALCFWLRSIGIERSCENLREEIIKCLRESPSAFHSFPLELYAGQAWSDYLAEMIEDGTNGDQITLQAASNLFNVQLTIQSSLGVEGNAIISPFTGVSANFHLVNFFAEGEGEHYVCFKVEDEVVDGEIEHTSEEGNESDGENVNMMEVKVGEDEENKTAGAAEQEEHKQRKNKKDRMKEGVDSSVVENVCNAMSEHHNEATCSFDQLPNELVSNILETVFDPQKPVISVIAICVTKLLQIA